MGFGRFIVVRVLNALLVLVIALLLVSAIFSAEAERELRGRIEEQITNQLRNNPQLLRSMTQEQIAQWKAEQREILYRRYGLDKPLWQRVLIYAWDQLRLKLGKSTSIQSLSGSSDVATIILEALPRTILLFTTAQIITTVIGLILGLKAAQSAGSLLDKSLSVFALLTASLPMWWTGMLFIIIFSYYLGWLPSGGMISTPPPEGSLAQMMDIGYHMILPVFTAVFVSFGAWAYTARSVVINQFQEDYVMAARAKGVPERRVIFSHVLRAAAPPIVTMMAFGIIGSLGGAMISEIVFNWPGMGRLYWIAIEQRDVPVLLGNTTISVDLYLLVVVLMDIIYGFLDPRVKVGAAAKL